MVQLIIVWVVFAVVWGIPTVVWVVFFLFIAWMVSGSLLVELVAAVFMTSVLTL